MEELYRWFEAFLNELPPLLQLIIGMLIALGTFKLMVFLVDRIKRDKAKEDNKES